MILILYFNIFLRICILLFSKQNKTVLVNSQEHKKSHPEFKHINYSLIILIFIIICYIFNV